MTRVELEREALNLPDAERLELADALVESTVPFALDSTEQTKADRAIASYRADPHGIGWSSVVHSDPGISGGTPVFCGTRVPAKTLFDYLEGGETLKSLPCKPPGGPGPIMASFFDALMGVLMSW